MRSECLSDLQLDVLLAVEFAGANEDESQAHVAGCARCSARLAELERGRVAFEELGTGVVRRGAQQREPAGGSVHSTRGAHT